MTKLGSQNYRSTRYAPENTVNRPLAAKGLTSYRYVQPHGYIMIGAKDHWDALNEAQRSLTAGHVKQEQLQIWDGNSYIPVEWEAANWRLPERRIQASRSLGSTHDRTSKRKDERETDMPTLDYEPKTEFPPVTPGEDRIITEHRDAHLAAVELYKGVAAHMPGWKFEQRLNDTCWYGPTYRYKLVDGTGHAIALETGRYHVPRGKVHVSGYWPQKGENGPYTSPSDVRESSPSINVSLDRGHAVIAQQIQTRFLPEYTRIYGLILARIAEDNAYQDRRAMAWKRITDAKLVIDPRADNGQDPRGEVRIGTKGPDGWNYSQGYGSVRLTGDDSVQIELRSLPVETAMRVLRAIQGDK